LLVRDDDATPAPLDTGVRGRWGLDLCRLAVHFRPLVTAIIHGLLEHEGARCRSPARGGHRRTEHVRLRAAKASGARTPVPRGDI
jgi:hypothetical protein